MQHMYYDVKDGEFCIKEEIDADILKIFIEQIIDCEHCDTYIT